MVALLLSAIVATAYLGVRSARGRSAADPSLIELERAVSDPDASADVWMDYGRQLFVDRCYAPAAMAFKRVLEKDPYGAAANVQRAASLALAKDTDGLYAVVKVLVSTDPRLAQDVLGRPEIQPYLCEARFRELLSEARVQSMD